MSPMLTPAELDALLDVTSEHDITTRKLVAQARLAGELQHEVADAHEELRARNGLLATRSHALQLFEKEIATIRQRVADLGAENERMREVLRIGIEGWERYATETRTSRSNEERDDQCKDAVAQAMVAWHRAAQAALSSGGAGKEQQR